MRATSSQRAWVRQRVCERECEQAFACVCVCALGRTSFVCLWSWAQSGCSSVDVNVNVSVTLGVASRRSLNARGRLCVVGSVSVSSTSARKLVAFFVRGQSEWVSEWVSWCEREARAQNAISAGERYICVSARYIARYMYACRLYLQDLCEFMREIYQSEFSVCCLFGPSQNSQEV